MNSQNLWACVDLMLRQSQLAWLRAELETCREWARVDQTQFGATSAYAVAFNLTFRRAVTPLQHAPRIYIMPRSGVVSRMRQTPTPKSFIFDFSIGTIHQEASMLTVESQPEGNAQVITVNGRVDGFSAPQLDEALQSAINAKQYKLVVDLGGTEFMSSAGMRALLNARLAVQDKKGDLRLAAPSAYLLDSLKLVGLNKLFKIYDTRAAATASF